MNVDKVLNFAFPTGPVSWGEKDVMLYALGLGLDDLRYVYERDLVVLPHPQRVHRGQSRVLVYSDVAGFEASEVS